MRYAIFLVVLLQPPEGLDAQEMRAACLPPVRPDTALPEEVLTFYRKELIVEFEQYFQGLSDYVTCLDAERAAVLEEARDVTSAYADFLEVATKDENR